MNLSDYQKLKEKVERLQSESDRSAGALDQLKHRLNDEFECQTIKEAKLLLEQWQDELESQETEFEKASDEFAKKYSDRLQSIS